MCFFKKTRLLLEADLVGSLFASYYDFTFITLLLKLCCFIFTGLLVIFRLVFLEGSCFKFTTI